jgi:hypothetical protein
MGRLSGGFLVEFFRNALFSGENFEGGGFGRESVICSPSRTKLTTAAFKRAVSCCQQHPDKRKMNAR